MGAGRNANQRQTGADDKHVCAGPAARRPRGADRWRGAARAGARPAGHAVPHGRGWVQGAGALQHQGQAARPSGHEAGVCYPSALMSLPPTPLSPHSAPPAACEVLAERYADADLAEQDAACFWRVFGASSVGMQLSQQRAADAGTYLAVLDAPATAAAVTAPSRAAGRCPGAWLAARACHAAPVGDQGCQGAPPAASQPPTPACRAAWPRWPWSVCASCWSGPTQPRLRTAPRCTRCCPRLRSSPARCSHWQRVQVCAAQAARPARCLAVCVLLPRCGHQLMHPPLPRAAPTEQQLLRAAKHCYVYFAAKVRTAAGLARRLSDDERCWQRWAGTPRAAPRLRAPCAPPPSPCPAAGGQLHRPAPHRPV